MIPIIVNDETGEWVNVDRVTKVVLPPERQSASCNSRVYLRANLGENSSTNFVDSPLKPGELYRRAKFALEHWRGK